MSKCANNDIGKNLDRYLLDLLSTEETEQFERHLLECDYCAEEVEKNQETSAHLLHSDFIKAGIAKMVKDDNEMESVQSDRPLDTGYVPWWKRRMVWATAAIFIILLLKPWKFEFAPDETVFAGNNRVAILPINTQESTDYWLGDAATNLLITNLSESDQLTILTTQQLHNVLEYLDMEKISRFDANLAVSVAEKANANWAVIGQIDQIDPALKINIVLLNVSTGDTVTNENLSGKAAGDLFTIIDEMTDTLKINILQDRNINKGIRNSVVDITTRSPEAYRQYLKGLKLLDQLYFIEAESCFVKAISYDSTFAMAYYYLATINDSRYIENASRFIDRSSRREQYYIRAYAALIDKDTIGFFNEIEKLIKDFPFDARAYYWYASIQNTFKNRQVALDYYYRAIEIDPYFKLTYNNMSYIFMNIGDYDKALWANDMYIAISPDEANPYDTRGDIYAKMGEFDKAIESYLKALEIKPFFGHTYSKLCELYQLTRNFEQARHWYKMGWSNEHDDPFPANITANMFVAEGKFEKAIKTLDEALSLAKQGIQKSSSVEEIIICKSRILAEKDLLLSLKELETISGSVDSLPDFQRIDYDFMHTRLLYKLEYFQSVDSCLKKLEQEVDTSTFSQYKYYLIAGDIHLQRKLYKDAIKYLERARDLKSPNYDFDSQYLLAIAYIESNRFSEAITELTLQLKNSNYRRAQLPIWNAKIHYYLGRAYEGLEKYQLAVEQYRHFVKIWSDSDWRIKEIDDAKSRLIYLNKAS